MAEMLETWGEGNAWNEVQLLLAGLEGKVLDIACGTGKTISILSRFNELEIDGCDISDFLLDKAKQRGIDENRLFCCDATSMPFEARSYDYSYSIGSLEHFTEEGILQLLNECKRVVTKKSFHMIPVSRSGRDEGWISTFQSYWNNSPEWWTAKCETVFTRVTVLDSVWQDDRSVGKWLVCET